VAAPAVTAPLRRNRDFNLLWSGQVLSSLGTRVSGIAIPLLVLARTHSPAKAGIAEFAGALPIFVLTLPAGALVDRWDRKRLLVVCDAIRCVAYVTLALAVAAGRISFVHILAVVLVDGCGFVFFGVAERSALRHVVADEHLPTALARNQARDYAALLGGPPLGGLLYSLGRAVPFVFDAVSYAVSVVSLSFLRARLQAERDAVTPHLLREVREGLVWFWREPFIRTTSLLVTGSDLVVNALWLVVIVLARERGASAALVGALFGFLGVGGLLGALVAPRLARRLSRRAVVIGMMWLQAVLVPLLFVPGAVTAGVVYGAMFLLHPTWNAVVGGYRIRATPDELLGRVQSVATLLSLGSVPFAFLLVGFLLEAFGTTPTVLALAVVMAVVAVAAVASPAIRVASARP
jgi:predicted MFS family arabinose efflux permease